MTDLPPRPPLGIEERRLPEARTSQTSMWLVLLLIAALILAIIAFTVNGSNVVDDPADATAPDAALDAGEAIGTTPAPAETTAAPATETDPAPDGNGATGTADPAVTPPPATTDGTAPANP